MRCMARLGEFRKGALFFYYTAYKGIFCGKGGYDSVKEYAGDAQGCGDTAFMVNFTGKTAGGNDDGQTEGQN